MLVKKSGSNFIIAISEDESAALVADYLQHMNTKGSIFHPEALVVIEKINEVYFYETGINIIDEMQEWSGLGLDDDDEDDEDDENDEDDG